ncbi:MAG: alpha-2-macroglobulin family protein, partial [Caldilineaceae bacterium]
ITEWRVSLVASDRNGRLGATTLGINVFQPFFVEPDLPTHFTAGDSVSIPVAIYNYLDAPQVVAVELAPVDGVELLGVSAQSVTLAANEVTSIAIPVRFTRFGDYALRFDATATPANDANAAAVRDAIEKVADVRPAGERVLDTKNLLLSQSDPVRQEVVITVRESIDPAATSVTVNVFPDPLADAQQGLEALLQAPYGCFEQVTSVTYLNTLVLAYLEQTGQAVRLELDVDAIRADIVRGLQAQIGYEVPGQPGGFEWYGQPPAVPYLTAYGLMSFVEMQRVTWVDPALIQRTAAYLLSLQDRDGAWRTDEGAWWGVSDVTMTAQMVWALAAAGYADTPEVQRGVEFLLVNQNGRAVAPAFVESPATPTPWQQESSGRRPPPPPPSPLVAGGSTSGQPAPGNRNGSPPENTATPVPANWPTMTPTWTPTWTPDPFYAPLAETPTLSNYELALTANALIAAGADPSAFLEALARNTGAFGLTTWGPLWMALDTTWSGASGNAADMETTALATLAFTRAGGFPELAETGMGTLLAARDASGSF